MTLMDLKVEHNNNIRPVSVAVIRQSFADIHWRTWKHWRDLAECPHGAQKVSRLSALKLWVLAISNGVMEAGELSKAVNALLKEKGEVVAKWLQASIWSIKGWEAVMKSINNLHPCLDCIHRQRLYDWFKKAGMRFSVKNTYSHAQLCRVVGVALLGVNLGRPRR